MMNRFLMIFGLGALLCVSSCMSQAKGIGDKQDDRAKPSSKKAEKPKSNVQNPATPENPGAGLAKATFAGGCFWCIQPPFDKLKGVVSTLVGYTGGVKKNPLYKEVAYGLTKHTEAIEVIYDPKKITYEKLLHVFWVNIDPMAKDRQFVDAGKQYRSGIFYHNETQRKLAEASKKALAASKRFPRPIVTEITKATAFYRAEEYHQKFYIKSTAHYKRYAAGSGRKEFKKRYWPEEK